VPHETDATSDRSGEAGHSPRLAGKPRRSDKARSTLAGALVTHLRKLFRRRTHALIVTYVAGVCCLLGLGLTSSFPVAIALVVVWGLAFAMAMPLPLTVDICGGFAVA